jgi:alkylhydroperoxidase family enzyme
MSLRRSSASSPTCSACSPAARRRGLNLAKISPEEIALNRKGPSSDPKATAAVHFAARVAETRGHVSDEDLVAIRKAGYSDAQVLEIVAMVVENVFTNFVNEVAKTDIDFPVVQANDLKAA